MLPHYKKIIFVVRDTAPDIDTGLLRQVLMKSLNDLPEKYQNKCLKFTVECCLMSHFVYEFEEFRR